MENRFVCSVGCLLIVLLLGGAGPESCGGEEESSTEADIAQYESLRQDLEKGRTQFLGKEADELWSNGDVLFWLEFPTFDPNLNSWDSTSNTKQKYSFSISTQGTYDYRGDKDMIVTAAKESDKVVYRAYAFGAANSSLGNFQLNAPKDGTRWYAYDVQGKNVYVMVTGSGTTLERWTVGGTLTKLYRLEDQGVQVGEFWDFKVFNKQVIFIESGRIWTLDLQTGKATWLQNKKQAQGAAYNAKGVLFAQSSRELSFMAVGSTTLRDITQEIKDSGFKLNNTFNQIHYPANGQYDLYNDTVIYTGQSGIFTFDLISKKVTPLLLETRDPKLRIVYRKPVTLENGTLFVLGLESTNGAVGADGPIYKLTLK